jgi:hypothetical protein
VNVAVVAKSEVLVALPTWLVGELPRLQYFDEPGFVLGKRDDAVADAVLLKEHGERVVAKHVHDFKVVRLVGPWQNSEHLP